LHRPLPMFHQQPRRLCPCSSRRSWRRTPRLPWLRRSRSRRPPSSRRQRPRLSSSRPPRRLKGSSSRQQRRQHALAWLVTPAAPARASAHPGVTRRRWKCPARAYPRRARIRRVPARSHRRRPIRCIERQRSDRLPGASGEPCLERLSACVARKSAGSPRPPRQAAPRAARARPPPAGSRRVQFRATCDGRAQRGRVCLHCPRSPALEW
jgi:hypothetical protein